MAYVLSIRLNRNLKTYDVKNRSSVNSFRLYRGFRTTSIKEQPIYSPLKFYVFITNYWLYFEVRNKLKEFKSGANIKIADGVERGSFESRSHQ